MAPVLLDIWLPGIDGLATSSRIEEIRRRPARGHVVISGHGNIETAVRATVGADSSKSRSPSRRRIAGEERFFINGA
jgi:DNA-binding NtrC family response regulator